MNKNMPSAKEKSININKTFVLLSEKSGFCFVRFFFNFTLTLFRVVHPDSNHAQPFNSLSLKSKARIT